MADDVGEMIEDALKSVRRAFYRRTGPGGRGRSDTRSAKPQREDPQRRSGQELPFLPVPEGAVWAVAAEAELDRLDPSVGDVGKSGSGHRSADGEVARLVGRDYMGVLAHDGYNLYFTDNRSQLAAHVPLGLIELVEVEDDEVKLRIRTGDTAQVWEFEDVEPIRDHPHPATKVDRSAPLDPLLDALKNPPTSGPPGSELLNDSVEGESAGTDGSSPWGNPDDISDAPIDE